MMSVYINEVTLSQSVCRHQLKLFVIITVFFFCTIVRSEEGRES